MVWVVARGGWVYVKRAVVRIGGGWVGGCALVWLSLAWAGWLALLSERVAGGGVVGRTRLNGVWMEATDGSQPGYVRMYTVK